MRSSLERREWRRLSSTYWVQEGAGPQACVEVLPNRKRQLLERASPFLVHPQETDPTYPRKEAGLDCDARRENLIYKQQHSHMLNKFENIITEHL